MQEREIKPGIYRHFKGNHYWVEDIAEHTETGEQMVVYRALYGENKLYTRPLEMFASEVDHDKYPDVEQKYRFEEITLIEGGETFPESMLADVYQELAMRTAAEQDSWKDQLTNGLMGLCGESGECIDYFKKVMFQGHALNKEKLAEELGDVAWYLAYSADAIGYKLSDILESNVEKMRKRYPDGFDAERSVNRG